VIAPKTLAARIAASALMANIAAYAAAEVAGKVSRLATVIAMARVLDPVQIGIAAGALAVGEIMKSLTENGIGQMVIAASSEEVEAKARTARRLFWMWCSGLFVAQAALAGAVYLSGGGLVATLLIALLAIEYLMMPGGLVQCALAMREGKLRQTATIAGAQNVGSNVATAILLLIWPSPFSVVIGKLLTAPVWLIAMRRLRPYTPADVAAAPVAPFVAFGRSVLGIELVRALRLQADKLIIGAMLGADALGVYFFAVNAGLGLATSFSTALATVLYPHLCASEERDADFRRASRLSFALIAPIVAIQALAAPIYVPMIFGAKWADVAPLVSILCLAAIPAVLWSATSQYLRASGRVNAEFRRAAMIALVMNAATLAAAPFGLTAVAWAFLVSATASQVVASIVSLRSGAGAPRLAPAL